jgi:hypothetical protein
LHCSGKILLLPIEHIPERTLSRVINPEGSGKERTQLTRSVVLALRELVKQQDVNENTRDLAAYITLALHAIAKTIDTSVEAWEKRGYWLKADRFRLEWAWTERLGNNMQQALLKDDWPNVALISGQVAEKLHTVEIPQRHKLGTPWVGAWQQLTANGTRSQPAGAGSKNLPS